MWSPTHVQVTVQKARGLLTKGKHGTNNAFVTIALGKEKYQTSLKEKASDTVEWHEKCELQIPKQGNTAEITLTALHHNFVGVDEFLGYINIPLAELDVYERPKNKWLKLKDKPGKDKKKDRGELEVKVAFIVKAGSLSDLSKKEKHKSSLGSLAFSGSLISIGSLDKRKGLKKLASKIGKKVSGKSKKNEEDDQGSQNLGLGVSKQVPGEADPGVISEGESEDDFTDSSREQSMDASTVNVSQNEDKDNEDDEEEANVDENVDSPATVTENSEETENTEKNQNFETIPSPTVEKTQSQTLEKVQSVGANVSKHWMKAYRKIKIGHASIRMLDELSHKGSGFSLENTPSESRFSQSPNLSNPATSTPAIEKSGSGSGSLENLAGGEILRRSSITSLPTPPMKPPRITTTQPEKKVDEWEQKLYGKHGKEGGSSGKMETLKRRLSVLSLFTSVDEQMPSPPPPISSNIREEVVIHQSKTPSPSPSCKEFSEDMKPAFSPSAFNRSTMERIIIGGETEKPVEKSSRLSNEVIKNYEGKSREDLIEMILDLESKLKDKRNQQKDLEDYLDNLLLRVMETSPRILQNPYISCKTQAQII